MPDIFAIAPFISYDRKGVTAYAAAFPMKMHGLLPRSEENIYE
jgi:hypothetical protein